MSRRLTIVPEVSVTGHVVNRFSMATLRALMAWSDRESFSRLDDGLPEKLGSRGESRFDLQAFIKFYTKQLCILFARLIRIDVKKLQKSLTAK